MKEKKKNERKRLNINDKNASKKQFTTFVSLAFGSLLPYSYTLAHLEHSWSILAFTCTWREEIKGK